jgi:hypothetical protein
MVLSCYNLRVCLVHVWSSTSEDLNRSNLLERDCWDQWQATEEEEIKQEA